MKHILRVGPGKQFILMTQLLALVLVLGLSACSSGRVARPASLQRASEFVPPKPVEFQLSNGLSIVLLEDKELPLVSATLSFPGGSLYETKEQVGLLSALGSQMREGGAGDLSAYQLDARLEELAADVGSAFGDELGSVSFSCLSSDLEQVFPIFADVLLRPRFELGRLNLWKKQTLEGIRRRRDSDETVLFISAKQLLFGDSARGRSLRSEDLDKIDRLELLRAHRRFVVPDQAILSVAGNVSRRQLEPLLERYLGTWEGSRQKLAPFSKTLPQPVAGIYFVEMPFKQAGVVIAQPGVPRHTPDQYAIDVFNEVFGGGSFDSRLVETVREKHGLAYVVYGRITPAEPRGSNMIFFQTDGVKVPKALQESMAVLKEMQQVPVTPQELSDVKRTIKNSFVFKFDRPSEISARQAAQKLLGYPADFDAKYLERIENISAQDVTEVARNLWDPAQFVVVVVGDKTAYNSLATSSEVFKQLGLASTAIKRLQFDQTLVDTAQPRS